jgi:hypothetical protein
LPEWGELGAHEMEIPQAFEHPEQLRGLPEPPAPHECPSVRVADLGCRVASSGHPGGTEAQKQGDLALGAGAIFGQRQQLQGAGEMAYRLVMGAIGQGTAAGMLQVPDGSSGVAAKVEVSGQLGG